MKFAELARVHRDIEVLFRLHQMAIIERRMEEAANRLSDMARALSRHVHDEETHLIPAYMLVGPKKGADLDALKSEHRKIDEMTRRAVSEFAALGPKPAAEAILALLDLEHRLRSLLEHHFLREENLVFPALDTGVDLAERDRLLGLCAHSATLPAEALI